MVNIKIIEDTNTMEIDALKIALEYAREHGKDTVRSAGERNGYKYFHVFIQATRGHKLGPYQYIKINPFGEVLKIYDIQEIQWAGHQEALLNTP